MAPPPGAAVAPAPGLAAASWATTGTTEPTATAGTTNLLTAAASPRGAPAAAEGAWVSPPEAAAEADLTSSSSEPPECRQVWAKA